MSFMEVRALFSVLGAVDTSFPLPNSEFYVSRMRTHDYAANIHWQHGVVVLYSEASGGQVI